MRGRPWSRQARPTSGGSTDELVTAGGRVLAVIGTGASIADARDAAYRGVAVVEFEGAQHRTDIAGTSPEHTT